jgi:hypothetical protein
MNNQSGWQNLRVNNINKESEYEFGRTTGYNYCDSINNDLGNLELNQRSLYSQNNCGQSAEDASGERQQFMEVNGVEGMELQLVDQTNEHIYNRQPTVVVRQCLRFWKPKERCIVDLQVDVAGEI